MRDAIGSLVTDGHCFVATGKPSASGIWDGSVLSDANGGLPVSDDRKALAPLDFTEEMEIPGAGDGSVQFGVCDGEARHDCCECRHKNTERSVELQRDIQKRLNRAIGQLNGVKSMIEDNRYCGDVLTQLAAVESAVHRAAEIILQNHMETCVVEQIRAGNMEVVDEAVGLIRKFL